MYPVPKTIWRVRAPLLKLKLMRKGPRSSDLGPSLILGAGRRKAVGMWRFQAHEIGKREESGY